MQVNKRQALLELVMNKSSQQNEEHVPNYHEGTGNKYSFIHQVRIKETFWW